MSKHGKSSSAFRQQTIPMNLPEMDTARWIWHNAVPEKGQCACVQGELIRSIGKLRWEAQNNGNGNWDDRFEMFVSYLRQNLGTAECFSVSDLRSLHEDLDRLMDFKDPYIEDDLYERLTSLAVEYCRATPAWIPHQHNPDQSR